MISISKREGYSPIQVNQTNDRGFLIVGNGSIIRLDKYGNIKWKKATNNISSYVPLIQTNDRGFLIFDDGYVIKLDKDGDIKWKKIVIETVSKISSISDFASMIQTNDEGLLIVKNGFLLRTKNGKLVINALKFS